MATFTTPPQQILEKIKTSAGTQAMIRSRTHTPATAGNAWGAPGGYPFGPWMYGTPPPPAGWTPYTGYSPTAAPSHQLHSKAVGSSPAAAASSAPASPAPPKCSATISPLIADWLVLLDSDGDHGRDNLHFSQYETALTGYGVIWLEDLVDLKTAEHVECVIQSNWGTANWLLKYAKEDVAGFTSSKKGRYSK